MKLSRAENLQWRRNTWEEAASTGFFSACRSLSQNISAFLPSHPFAWDFTNSFWTIQVSYTTWLLPASLIAGTKLILLLALSHSESLQILELYPSLLIQSVHLALKQAQRFTITRITSAALYLAKMESFSPAKWFNNSF